MASALFLPPPRSLASFSWKGFGVFLVFAAALSAWWWSGVLLTAKTLTLQEHAEYYLKLLQQNLLSYSPLFLLVTLADGLPLAGRRRALAIGAAVLLGAALAVQTRCLVRPDVLYYVYGSQPIRFCSAFPTWRTYVDLPGAFFGPLVMGSLVTAFVLARRRQLELERALRTLRAARLEARRTRIEADIAAMRTRVEPDALIASLRAVGARYEASLAEGEERLDALIRELREAAGGVPPRARAA